MAALKVLVIVMGLLIVAGVAVLAATIVARISHKGSTAGTSASFTAAPIEIPAGAHIEAMTAGPDRLVLELKLADGSFQLLVIDLASGRRVGAIPLRVAP